MGRRSLLLVASVLFATIGTFLVFLYASNAQKAAAAGAAPVEVLVAEVAIPAGTSGGTISASGDVVLKTLPAASVPPGALSDLAGVKDLLNAVPIYAGQVLIADMFAGADTTNALTLPKGTMAMSVELTDPQRVAGFVTPGSEVAVFATLDLEDAQGSRKATIGDQLLDRVRVVAVGPSTLRPAVSDDDAGTNAEEIPTAIITLAVTAEQGKRLAFAAAKADLHIALLNQASEGTTSPTVTTGNLFASAQ